MSQQPTDIVNVPLTLTISALHHTPDFIGFYHMKSQESPNLTTCWSRKTQYWLTKVHSLALSGHLAPLQYSCTSPPVQHKCKYRGKMIMPSSKFFTMTTITLPITKWSTKCPLLSVNTLITSSYFYLSWQLKYESTK